MNHFHKHLSKTILFPFLPLLLLAGIFIFSPSLFTQASGETAYWKFDETSGTSASDSSGNNLTGTLVNGPTWVAGKLGNAVQLDGINDYISAGNGASLNITNAITIEAWINPSSRDIMNIASKKWSYGLYDSNNKLMFSYYPSSENTYVSSSEVLTVNEWNHVAVSFVPNGSIILYVNGVSVPGSWTKGNGAAVMPIYTNNFSIGNSDSYTGYKYFKGIIDEIKLFNRALTSAEVQADYNDGTVPDTTPPVISGEAASSIISSGATITWTTDEASDTQIEYGTTISYGNLTALNPSMVVSHSQALINLTASTLYHYRVKSKDGAGNLATGTDKTFTTAEIYVPVLTSIAVSPATASISIGSTQTFTATPKDQNGNAMTGVTINWSSSNIGIATVAPGMVLPYVSNGIATGVALGTVTIIASSGNISGSASLTVTEVSACTVTVGDHAPADFIADHSIRSNGQRDEFTIQQAIDQVALCAKSLQEPGTVILKIPTNPYIFRYHVDIDKPYVIVQGETSIPKADGNQQVTIMLAIDAPNSGYTPGFFQMGVDNTQIKNIHLDGSVRFYRPKNGFWQGLENKRGYEAIYVGNDGNIGVSNILIENISAYDTTVDVIYGYMKYNVTVRNIRAKHIGHTVVDIRSFNSDSNLLIENVHCEDLVNACIRMRAMDGATVRNIVSLYPEINNGDRNVGYHTQFGIELFSEHDTPIQNLYFENIDVFQPNMNGIWLWQDPSITTQSRFHNITFKNVLIDCTPHPHESKVCRFNNDGGTYDASNADRPAAINLVSVADVTFDGLTVAQGGNGFRVANYMPSITSKITIKNSIFSNMSGNVIFTESGINNYEWRVDYNNFWNYGTLLKGYASLGTNINNKYVNPLYVKDTTSTPVWRTQSVALDFHLQSRSGHWNGTGWTNDNFDSPALSAGDPASDNSKSPSGGIIEMGAYGNTSQASRTGPDIIPPTVSSTDPTNNPNTVPISKTITLTFNETIESGTSFNSITLKDSSNTLIPTANTISSGTLTINPNSDLAYNKLYTLTIPTNAVKDSSNNNLASAYTLSFTTQALPYINSISISPATASILRGATQTFTATPQDQFNNPMPGIAIAWSSSNPSVATINSSGIATGIIEGTTTITASGGGKSAIATLTVAAFSANPTMDTSIKSGQPTTARGANAFLDLGRLSGTTNGNYRGLLNFDLSSIPANATINNAILTLYFEGESTATPRTQPTTISIFRPASSWTNSTTWNSWTPTGGSWFDANGTANGSTPYATLTYPLNSTQDAIFDVKSLVQSYINGTPNTGFFLKANEVDTTYLAFHSSEAADAAKKPKLTISYSTGPTAPSAPQTLTGTAGDSSVSLTWSLPSSTGGSPITGYKVYRGISSNSETFLANSSILSYTDNSVTNGTTYYYQITALNSIGESPRSDETIANPQPTKIQGTVSNSSNLPIQGATVTAGANSAITDSQGFYTLTVPAGTYAITVNASSSGYVSQSKTADVVTAQTTTVNFSLASSSKSSDLNTDGIVNSVDFGIMMSAWSNTLKPKADLNQDGIVNSVDFGIMMSEWG